LAHAKQFSSHLSGPALCYIHSNACLYGWECIEKAADAAASRLMNKIDRLWQWKLLVFTMVFVWLPACLLAALASGGSLCRIMLHKHSCKCCFMQRRDSVSARLMVTAKKSFVTLGLQKASLGRKGLCCCYPQNGIEICIKN